MTGEEFTFGPSPYLKHLYVCVNRREAGKTCCAASASEAIRERIKAYVKANGLEGKVRVSGSGCMNLCAQGPNVMVYPGGRWYSHVTLADVDRIIKQELTPLVGAAHPEPVEGERPRPSTTAGRAEPPAIRAFLFDLGNVLVRFDHRQAARKIADGTGADPEALFKIFFESPLVIDHDEGRISTPAFYEGLRRQIGLSLTYEGFLEVWNHIFTEDPDMMRLLEGLLQRAPCYLISNTNRPHFEYLRQSVPLLDRMSGWILSYEVGHLKPHPAIYHRALERVRLPARQILYIDDREDLIEAGGRLGFQTHRFAGFEGFAKELTDRGVI